MNIGNKIKELRKQRGLTQEQLANDIGVSFQAVSKWENNISLPDITLAPMLASYFGVSLDTLFDFHLQEVQEKALAIAKESWNYRDSDWAKARDILNEGLKKYPKNDILLENLLYVIDYDETPEETIKIASEILDVTKDDAIRYHAYRFMAYAYKAKGDLDSARTILDQIPELYFSRLSEKAHLLCGKEKWHAACSEEGVCLQNLIEMKECIAEYYIEQGSTENALKEYRQALAVLDALEVSERWDWAKEHFQKLIEKIS